MSTAHSAYRLLASSFVVYIGLAMSAVTVLADSWDTPKPKDFTSPSGNRTFKLTLGERPGFFGAGNGALILHDKNGKEKTVWQRQLVNIPHQAFVSDKSNHVVTVDTYARLGFQNSLVLYGEDGKVLATYQLEDLLTSKEIRDKVKRTVSSRWWASGAKFGFSPDGNEFIATLSWGKVIKIDLANPPASKFESAGTGRREAPATEIWTGNALNSQLQEIQSGGEGLSIPLTAELLQRINFTREGKKGSTAMLTKAAGLEWPAAMKAETFKKDREQIETLLQRARESMKKGGTASSIKELADAVQRLNPALALQVDELTPVQYIQAKRLILHLEDTVKLLEDPDASRFLKSAEQVVAKSNTVASLAANMKERKLRFAPAAPGEEKAYTALHGAFAEYLKNKPRK
jgi:hypothetical protein